MIKAASAHTFEIDDIPAACRELKAQLNGKLTLLCSSVGIVRCDPEFIEAGILEPLYQELGIPLVGGTTVAIATNDAMGSLMFSLLVLTSDDVEFVTARTEGLAADYAGAIGQSLQATLGASAKPLGLALVFPPILEGVAGDCYIEEFERACGAAPIFGALSADDDIPHFRRVMSVFNGEALKQEAPYVLLFGDVNPRFFVATVPAQSNLMETDAVVTRAKDNVIYEINGMPAIKYFESIGLAANGALKHGTDFVPLLVGVKESGGAPRNAPRTARPFVRALTGVDGDGSIQCSGKAPEGAQITIGSNYGIEVLLATLETVTKVAREKNVGAALLFSCVVRQLVIGADSMKELAQIKSTLPGDMPFMASYAGGEISPIGVTGENNPRNCFHNYSFITCLL